MAREHCSVSHTTNGGWSSGFARTDSCFRRSAQEVAIRRSEPTQPCSVAFPRRLARRTTQEQGAARPCFDRYLRAVVRALGQLHCFPSASAKRRFTATWRVPSREALLSTLASSGCRG
jgi:hypothetical protein